MMASHGTINVARKRPKTPARHRKGRKANAYAAKTLVTSWDAVIRPACSTELRYCRPSGMTVKTSLRLSRMHRVREQ
jgi:hypothetical protein